MVKNSAFTVSGTILEGLPYVFKRIPISLLFSQQAYQRPLNQKRVNYIASHFDEKLFDPIVVSFRDNFFYVVDGQHRVAVLRQRSGNKNVLVPCNVFIGLTYQQEADYFEKTDVCKTRLGISDSLRAQVESGTNESVLFIKKTLESNGIVWVFSRTGANGPNQVSASRALLNAYGTLREELFSRTIHLIKATWNGSTKSLGANMLSGMTTFMDFYESSFSDNEFIRKLGKYTPEEIIMEGHADIAIHDNGLKYARVILRKYNKNRSKDQLKYLFDA